MQFISYGEVADAAAAPLTVPGVAPAPVSRARADQRVPDELVRPHPGARPGAIAIDLTTGVRLVVDSYVKEKALARVLRGLREASC